MSKIDDEVTFGSKFQKVGVWLAVAFFILSVIMVIRNHGGMTVFSPDTKVLTFAHWQLEDGFREGFEEAIKIYEKEKERQGVKVRVRQVAVPVRGYSQWFLTQLIGGEPADVLELTGNSDIHNQYFTPLSPFIGEKNPWNKGTPLENYSWRESFSDDMLAALDLSYSEFFGVCLFASTTRVYVNVDLYKKAVGTDKMPETVTQWLDTCEKMREYGLRHNRPIIPIGVRGFDKGTLGQLFSNYTSQLCSGLSDTGNDFGYGVAQGTLFRQINDGELDKEVLLRPVELVTEIGQYFADGFPAIDLEQTKYLFFSGNVGYFLDGSWNAYSMVNNSPFPVKIINIPVLAKDHPLGKYSYGRITELGSGISGKFGIPKKTKHFDLALDFLRFITSYKINQLTMVEHCRWLSSLKKVKYTGLMEALEPITNTPNTAVATPFNTGVYGTRKTLQRLENIIIANPPNPKEAFWNDFLSVRNFLIDEINENNLGVMRTLWSMDGTRSALAFSEWTGDVSPADIQLSRMRGAINLEGIVSRYRAAKNNETLVHELGRLKEYNENGN